MSQDGNGKKPVKEWVKLSMSVIGGVTILALSAWLFSIDKTVETVRNQQDNIVRIEKSLSSLEINYSNLMSKIETVDRNTDNIFKLWTKLSEIDTRIDDLDSNLKLKVGSLTESIKYTDRYIDNININVRELRSKHLQ
jgi:septation ring formation regulator EzrA